MPADPDEMTGRTETASGHSDIQLAGLWAQLPVSTHYHACQAGQTYRLVVAGSARLVDFRCLQPGLADRNLVYGFVHGRGGGHAGCGLCYK